MRIRWVGRIAPALAVLLASCSLNPILIGQIYRIDTPRKGACAPLELHFLVNAQHAVSGDLLRDHQSLGNLSGTLGPDGSFHFTAAGAFGSGTVSGRFTSGASTIAISGPVAGAACDGQTFRLYLGQYLRFYGGGGGGEGR